MTKDCNDDLEALQPFKVLDGKNSVISLKGHAMAPRPPQRFATALLITANIATTVALVLVNKHIFAAFPWPIIVTLGHQASCWLVTALMARAGAMAVPAVPRRDAALIGGAMVLGIFLYNYSLKLNSVSVYQLSKMACLPCIAVLQRVLFGEPMPSRPVGWSLAILLLGVFLSTKQDFSAQPAGLIAAIMAMLMTALAQVSLQHMPSMKGITGMQSVAVLSPAATLVLAVLALFIEVPAMRAASQATSATPDVPYGLIIMSCAIAISTNWLGNSLIQQTSALTFQVVGHLKTVMILFFGAIFFASEESTLSLTKLVGIILSFMGLFAYTFFKMNPELTHVGGIKGAIVDSIKNNPIVWVKSLSWTSLLLLVFLCASLLTNPTTTVIYQQVKAPLEEYSIADLTTALWSASNDTQRFKYDRRPNLKDPNRKPSVVILSADDRHFASLDLVKDADPRNLPYLTSNTIYKQWWAIRHGYDYRHIIIGSPTGWFGSWAKIKAIYSMLFKYDYVIFLDSDAFINAPEINLDWMIDHWGFHANATFMMAVEPEHQPWPNNIPNDTAVNTGFVVVRSNDLSKRVFREVMRCPDNVEGCDRWRTDWAHEQTVFNMMMRGKYIMPEDLVIMPCYEANGWWADPRFYESFCKGKYITHAWGGKYGVPEKVSSIMLREHFRLYEQLLKQQDYHFMTCDAWEDGVNEQCPDPDEQALSPSNVTQS